MSLSTTLRLNHTPHARTLAATVQATAMSLLSLPEEVIYLILEVGRLDVKDGVALSEVRISRSMVDTGNLTLIAGLSKAQKCISMHALLDVHRYDRDSPKWATSHQSSTCVAFHPTG